MNKRLEKLARECGAWNQVYDQERFMVDSNFDVAKFAELIVRECEAKHFSEGYLCGKRDGRILAIHECSEYLRERGDISRSMDLKEHFGVEE